MVEVPSAQERVTAKATPAEAMACTKADSRVAAGSGEALLRQGPEMQPPCLNLPSWEGGLAIAEGSRRN